MKTNIERNVIKSLIEEYTKYIRESFLTHLILVGVKNGIAIKLTFHLFLYDYWLFTLTKRKDNSS